MLYFRYQHFVPIFSKLNIALLSQSCLEHLQEDKDLQVHLEAWSKQIELRLQLYHIFPILSLFFRFHRRKYNFSYSESI